MRRGTAQDLSEDQVVDYVFRYKQTAFWALDFMIQGLRDRFPSLPPRRRSLPEGMMFAARVGRTDLNLCPGRKPGDVDAVLIPVERDRLLFGETIALEVKVVRPTRGKPGRSPNSSGVEQVMGLIDDGFPRVGLLHLVLAEPLPGGSAAGLVCPALEQAARQGEMDPLRLTIDTFQFLASQRHFGRLVKLPLPAFVGVNSFGIFLGPDGFTMAGVLFADHRFGTRSPDLSKATVRSVAAHFERNPGKYKKVLWWQEDGMPSTPDKDPLRAKQVAIHRTLQ